MVSRQFKLKWRRILRRRRRQAAAIGTTTDEAVEKQLMRRLVKLPTIQRFLIGWIGLLFVLSGGVILQNRAVSDKYQDIQARSGGSFTEGIVGKFTNANPLYASSGVDSAVSNLVFSGLLKYDSQNKLRSELAESWSQDETETVYTVKLKENLKWQDGKPLTSKDVLFTYRLIQNPETKSYLNASWQNVKVAATDERTVVFTLPNALSSFPNSMINGIVPEHILKDIPPSQLRSNTFNNESPVGSGPFKFTRVEIVGKTPENRNEQIALDANENYNKGRPKLDRFIIKTFADEDKLVESFAENKVTAMVGLSSVPEQLKDQGNVTELPVPLNGQTLVFFKTTNEVLKDPAVRKALVLGADKKEVIDSLGYPLISTSQPLLEIHNGYDKALGQITGKRDEAKKILDEAGWVVDPATGIRQKGAQKLTFKLQSESTSEYTSVSGVLQKQWREIGVDMQVELLKVEDLQSVLALHTYDALLYGISIGPDPDVFAYWHSSQADPRSQTRLNFSEYNSTVVDRALEAGRTRSDPVVRAVKYKPFLEAWRNDAPALALYQPRFAYIVHEPFYGFDVKSASAATDRYADVEKWMIRQEKR